MLARGWKLGIYEQVDCQSWRHQCGLCDVSLCLQHQVRLMFLNVHDFGLMRAYMHLRNHGRQKWNHRCPPIWVFLGKQRQWQHVAASKAFARHERSHRHFRCNDTHYSTSIRFLFNIASTVYTVSCVMDMPGLLRFHVACHTDGQVSFRWGYARCSVRGKNAQGIESLNCWITGLFTLSLLNVFQGLLFVSPAQIPILTV